MTSTQCAFNIDFVSSSTKEVNNTNIDLYGWRKLYKRIIVSHYLYSEIKSMLTLAKIKATQHVELNQGFFSDDWNW